MASTFTKLRHDLSDDMEEQIARLQKEVASLRKSLNKRGSAAYDQGKDVASDLYDDLADRLSDALPHLRKQSERVGKAASDNPMTAALIGVGLVGLLAIFFSRR